MTVDEAQELRILSRRITAALVVVAVVAMVFTAVSVTTFALDHGVSPWVAWTLDPMVAGALLVVLLADARLVELGTAPSGWATALRWFAGMATWAMNSWQSFWPDGGFGVPRDVDPAGVVLHSVAPVLLVVLAEAATGYRRVIAARLRLLEVVVDDAVSERLATVDGDRVGVATARGGVRHGGHPFSVETLVDDHVRGAAEMVRLPDGIAAVVDGQVSTSTRLEDELSSWDEPWRAPWGNELPEASRHWEASAVGALGDLTDDRLDDRPETLRLPSKMVTSVVAGWSSTPVEGDQRDDHLDDQAHDHPGTFRDPGKMVAPVVADPVTSVAQTATQAYQWYDRPDDQGWAPVPTLGDQDAEVFRASPENFTDARKDQAGSVTPADATVVQTGAVAQTATVAEGYTTACSPAADHFPKWGSDRAPEGTQMSGTPDADHSCVSRSDGVGGTDPIGEGSGVVPTPAPEGVHTVHPPADALSAAEAMSDAELLRAARKLQRDAIRTTRNPVTILTLQTELGLSRRRAADLRRDVVGGRS